MARPRKEIDQKQFEALCHIQCTEEEICGVLGVTDKTLTRWCKQIYGFGFSETYKKCSAGGRMSIRRLQFDCAKRGNTSMLIWLGKQYLGQRDEPEDSVDMEDSEAYFNEAGI